MLSETVKARDSSLSHAQDKIKSLTDRVELLKAEAAASQAKAEKRIEQLNSAIERERAERAVAEGALEARAAITPGCNAKYRPSARCGGAAPPRRLSTPTRRKRPGLKERQWRRP